MRGINAFEPAEAVLAGAVPIGVQVELPDLGCNRPVQRRQDLALDQQDTVLDESLVPGLSDPCRSAQVSFRTGS